MFDFESLVAFIKASRETADDQTALKAKELYNEWTVGKAVVVGERLRYGERLYKVVQPHTTQADWTPDITASLYTVIDEEHKGTIDDPIPWSVNMECYENMYYTYNEVLYKATRDSGIALAYTPDQLVGQYFEIVE